MRQRTSAASARRGRSITAKRTGDAAALDPALDPALKNSKQARRASRDGRVVILGVDPSLRGTGYGVIAWDKAGPAVLAHGTIKVPADWERSRCLARIARTLREVVAANHPTLCVIEGLFFAQNLKTALTMGEARGAALAAVAEAGLEIYEMAPRRMKQAIVGYGAAGKDAVGRMVQRMLGLSERPGPDAADALALALAHGQRNGRALWAAAKRI